MILNKRILNPLPQANTMKVLKIAIKAANAAIKQHI